MKLDSGIVIAALVALAALLVVVILAIRKHAQTTDDQRKIERLQFALVTMTEVQRDAAVKTEDVVRRLVRTEETVCAAGDRALTKPEQVDGTVWQQSLARGTVVMKSMVATPRSDPSPVTATVHLPVTVKENLATGLAVGDSVAFTKEGAIVPQPNGTALDGFKIVGRLETPGQSPERRTVTLTVEVPAQQLEAAAALASDGWHPMVIKAAP